ncbi:MAG: 4'-phosphopantetheinyl transferase superfamily protein [Pseudomonadota bacterium]
MAFHAAKGEGRKVRVELTLLDIDKLAPRLEAFSALLSADERARAQRFHFERDRTRFTLGRAALRHVLSGHLDHPPEAIVFTYGPQRKPALEDGAMDFNASGSHGLVAIAVARGGVLGVDVERPRPNTDWPGIARRFFAPLEQEELFALPKARQEEGFLRLWTLKEAVIKFTGRGLGQGLESFAVSLAGDFGPRVAGWSSELSPPAALWTRPLDTGGHVSLACATQDIEVVLCDPVEALSPAALLDQ